MVSAAGYPIMVLIVQSYGTYVLIPLLFLLLWVRSLHKMDGAWIGKWYWALLVATGVEVVVFVGYWFVPVRIGEIMMFNGMLFGVMVASVMWEVYS